jgi:CheY-like chemotaxis protein
VTVRKSIRREFGDQAPQAIVLDDSPVARKATSRRLRSMGYTVQVFANVTDFKQSWRPGMVDVIIADWDLSNKQSEKGDHVLAEVREQDWDVPFVLISGQLGQASRRANALEKLLDCGNARFIERGDVGIKLACEAAEDLIERRDLALLKVILALRPAASEGLSVPTSAGDLPARLQLANVVSKPAKSHEAGRPLALARTERALRTKPSRTA